MNLRQKLFLILTDLNINIDNNLSNTESEYDKCQICGMETPYKKADNINVRKYYIEGAGQLCECCYKDVYSPKKIRKK